MAVKLIHGDAYKEIKKLADKSIDLIYTDVPYLMVAGGSGNSSLAHRITKSKDTLDASNLLDGFDYAILDEFVRVMKHIYIYIWCSKEQINDLMNYFIGKHKCKMNLLVWCKTNPIPAVNNTWLPDIEYCLVFKEEGAKRYNDGIENKSKWFVSAINKYDKDKYDHPTIKPIELVKRHLRHSCDKSFTVLDPFAGSSTTLCACRELGINAIGFEIDKKFFEIGKDRLTGFDQKGTMDLFADTYEQDLIFEDNL